MEDFGSSDHAMQTSTTLAAGRLRSTRQGCQFAARGQHPTKLKKQTRCTAAPDFYWHMKAAEGPCHSETGPWKSRSGDGSGEGESDDTPNSRTLHLSSQLKRSHVEKNAA